MLQMLWIPIRLPGYNQLLAARGVAGRKGWTQYSGVKRDWEEFILNCIRAQRLDAFHGAHFHYVLVEPGKRRRDPSNCLSGATKLIEDALQKASIIVDDRADNVWSITGQYQVDASTGVFVVISSEPVSLESAKEFWLNYRDSVTLDDKAHMLMKRLLISERKVKDRANAKRRAVRSKGSRFKKRSYFEH